MALSREDNLPVRQSPEKWVVKVCHVKEDPQGHTDVSGTQPPAGNIEIAISTSNKGKVQLVFQMSCVYGCMFSSSVGTN